MLLKITKAQLAILLAITTVGLCVLGISLGLFLGLETDKGRKGAVVTNGHECAEIGGRILEKGGSAVDAAIAATLCEGIGMPQSTGIGGGFFMTIYDRATGEVTTLNARETAPAAATEDMFDGNATIMAKGGLAVAIPGELRGYEAAHKKYGKLPWRDIIQPTLELCRDGHLVTEYLANMLKGQEEKLLKSETLREIFIDPETDKTYPAGHMLKRTMMAKTLQAVIDEGADALYDGSLTKGFVKDIADLGGIITELDMNNYKVEWLKPVESSLPNDQTLYTFPLPGSGVILTFIMNILSGYLDSDKPQSLRNWQRIVESFKYGYGKRTELGDRLFVPNIDELLANLTNVNYAKAIREEISDDRTFNDAEHYGANTTLVEDHGTAHISVLAPNGDAVSVTGTINLYFGAGIRSRSTGIILNDEMDDFSAENITNSFGMPPSPANYIKPGKRPLSSMCPSIVLDKGGEVKLVIGAAGGTKITTSVAMVCVKHLWYKEPIQAAVNDKRLHHQLFPMSIEFEDGNEQSLIDGLKLIGHEYEVADPADGFAAVIAISNDNSIVEGAIDPRRSGSIYYLK